MATKYVLQQRGVADGTSIPADKADGRQVNAMRKVLVASKPTDEAWNTGDVIFLGKKAAGSKITGIRLTTGTSLSTTTIDIGDGTTVDKYVDGATLTTTDRPTYIGPKASIADDDPDAGEVALWATILTTNIAAGVALTLEIELACIN